MIPKFRVWDKENEKMLVVNNICNLFWDTKFIECYELVSDTKGKQEYELIDHRIDFEDCVLMQSTGLFDVNDKEIFEGDIVKIIYDGKPFIGVVVYDLGEADFKATNNHEDYGNNFQYLTVGESIEVIGDIYQNPEFAEVSND